MDQLGDFFSSELLALQLNFQIDETKTGLISLLETYIPGFSDLYKERIEVGDRKHTLEVQGIAIGVLKQRITQMQELEKDAITASQYIGISDHLFLVYEDLFDKILEEINFCNEGVGKIKEQIQHMLALLTPEIPKNSDSPSENTQTGNKFQALHLRPNPKKRKRKKTSPNIVGNELSHIERLQQLGFIISDKYIKELTNLPIEQLAQLRGYLTTLENYEGNIFISNYITSLKNNPYIVLKFSDISPSYRIICGKDSHEIVDILPHRKYEKKYLKST